MGDIEVMCGIRQGCTGSPQLFLMVIGMVIEQILRSGMGFRLNDVCLPTLFYADDGLLLARSVKEAEKIIVILEEEAAKYGLKINKEKS